MQTSRALLLFLLTVSFLPAGDPSLPSPLTAEEKAELYSLQLQRETVRNAFFRAKDAMRDAADQFEQIDKQVEEAALRLQLLHNAKGFTLDPATLQWAPAAVAEPRTSEESADAASQPGAVRQADVVRTAADPPQSR